MSIRLAPFAVVVMLLVTGCVTPSDPDLYHGVDIFPAKKTLQFNLIDDTNSEFNSSSIEGSVWVVGFVFTNCPDFCSTVTTEMKEIQDSLTDWERRNTSFISITVDPWRDGPMLLTQYKESMNVTWPHLTTNIDSENNLSRIEDVWTNFEIGLVLTESQNSTSTSGRGHTVYYSIEHTNGVVLVDANGFQQVQWTEDNWNTTLIVEDVRMLLND